MNLKCIHFLSGKKKIELARILFPDARNDVHRLLSLSHFFKTEKKTIGIEQIHLICSFYSITPNTLFLPICCGEGVRIGKEKKYRRVKKLIIDDYNAFEDIQIYFSNNRIKHDVIIRDSENGGEILINEPENDFAELDLPGCYKIIYDYEQE